MSVQMGEAWEVIMRRSASQVRGLTWLLLSGPLLWLIAFTCVPLAMVIAFSFGERGPYGGVEFMLSGESYRRAMEWLYLRVILKSIGLAFRQLHFAWW